MSPHRQCMIMPKNGVKMLGLPNGNNLRELPEAPAANVKKPAAGTSPQVFLYARDFAETIEFAIELNHWDVVYEAVVSAGKDLRSATYQFTFRGEDSYGSPLHLLVAGLGSRLPFKTVNDILRFLSAEDEKDIEALCYPDTKNGFNPLHLAIQLRCDSSVLVTLLKHCPVMAQQQDRFGNFPLHYAACLSSPLLFALLEEYPAAAGKPNLRDQYPLHMLVGGADVNCDMLRKCLVSYPDAAKLPDRSGRFPCQIMSCNIQASKDCLQLVEEAFPGAPQLLNQSDGLPSDAAIHNKQMSEVRRLLQGEIPRGRKWWRSPMRRNKNGTKSDVPLDLHHCYW